MIKPMLLGNFDSIEKVFEEFAEYHYDHEGRHNDPVPGQENVEILFAHYATPGYEGGAFVLFRDKQTKKLFTVQGSHCSCYGLEGQWKPVASTVAGLRHEMTEGSLGKDSYEAEYNFAPQLTEFLDAHPSLAKEN